MASAADFLVEIGTEELPPRALPVLEAAFRAQILAGLGEAGLAFAGAESFATPRRLALLVRGLQLAQPDRPMEKRGPPLSAAFDGAGAPTRAATAFAAGCGVPVDRLERLETPKGSWLVYRGVEAGQPAAALLPGIVDRALTALPIPRRMRWGEGSVEFVRPVHWLVLMLGNQVIPATLLGQAAGNETRGHRFHGPGRIVLTAPAAYADTLEREGRVIPGFAARRERIRELTAEAARQAGGEAILEPALLDEVTALVEWPVPLAGQFSPDFLRLPEEVLIATLQGHQRYFPVRDAGGRLLPLFITVANLASRDPEQVRRGNERVILPRLTDAAFFWEQDRRTSLADRLPQLATVVYQHGLGSLADRSRRVGQIGAELARVLDCGVAEVERAAALAKADLLTQMVGEFPELQGRVGRHYALHDGESPAVAAAIEEQYLPRQAGDRLPASPVGRALALADRLDALAGIFALGKRPTGNKDPFALRRAALGLLRILIESGVDVDLPGLLALAIACQPGSPGDPVTLQDELQEFLTDRLRSYYLEGLAPGLPAGAVSWEIFESVRLRQPASPLDFHRRVLAVCHFSQLPEAASLASANKRIANILRPPAAAAGGDVRPALFEAPAEHALLAAVDAMERNHRHALADRDYAGALRALAALKAPVDDFFTAVLVMTEDEARRRNRLALLQRLRALFLDIADLSVLPGNA